MIISLASSDARGDGLQCRSRSYRRLFAADILPAQASKPYHLPWHEHGSQPKPVAQTVYSHALQRHHYPLSAHDIRGIEALVRFGRHIGRAPA